MSDQTIELNKLNEFDNASSVNEIERYNQYDDWAWLYDKTVAEDYGDPLWHWLQRELLPNLNQGASILDLCCGSGQLIKPLIKAGYCTSGLDGSESMLACAQRNAPEAKYILADARTFTLPNPVDAIVSTSASLNHIETMGDLAQVFSRVYNSLKDEGWFLFDVNHHLQMQRWWRGFPMEGQIGKDYAWMITPRYDATSANGAFKVTMYQPGGNHNPLRNWVTALLHTVLSKPRFIGIRLKVIQSFARVQPNWKKQEIDYPVYSHDLKQIQQALKQAGFDSIKMETIDGNSPVDENHSAHFICRKGAQ